MSYFFSTPVDIDIVLEDADNRQMVDVKLDKNRREKAPLYMDGESVRGAVTVRPKDGKRLEHTGIKVQFIGTIGTSWEKPVASVRRAPSWAHTSSDKRRTLTAAMRRYTGCSPTEDNSCTDYFNVHRNVL